MPPRGGYWNGEIGATPQPGGVPELPRLRKRAKTVDPKSYELACHFLSDCPKANEGDRTELAGMIQDVCEDYCQTVEQEHGPDHG